MQSHWEVSAEPVSAEPPGNDEEPPLPPPDSRPRREALDAELPLPPLPSKKNRSNKEPVSAEPLEQPEKSAPLGKETKNVMNATVVKNVRAIKRVVIPKNHGKKIKQSFTNIFSKKSWLSLSKKKCFFLRTSTYSTNISIQSLC